MNVGLHQKWLDLLCFWAVDKAAAEKAFVDVCTLYAGPGRFYHTLDHIYSVLQIVEGLCSSARNLCTVQLGAWLHDVIYDSKASDNEERSADYAQQLCESMGILVGRQVASLILKTKTHDASAYDPDAQVLLDADLAILGASEPVYRDYAEKIRQEYAWVPEVEYRQGRRQVMEQFLSRPRIFHLLTHLEEPARQNITAEIARLNSAHGETRS